jgi:hypothetical protein
MQQHHQLQSNAQGESKTSFVLCVCICDQRKKNNSTRMKLTLMMMMCSEAETKGLQRHKGQFTIMHLDCIAHTQTRIEREEDITNEKRQRNNTDIRGKNMTQKN